jgi:pimeloyl-ACP methyl ester carboxylesterase
VSDHDVSYAKTADGVHIAYQVSGGGPVDLVFVNGFAANFEIEYEEPRVARFMDRLAGFSRLIRFDKRGTGMSDRRQTPDLDMRADDLRAVLDAADSERAILFGESEGGALAAFFAATDPARVQGLVLYGTRPRYAWAPDNPLGMTPDVFQAEREAMVAGWGSVAYAQGWIEEEAPSWAGDPGAATRWARAMRHGASPAAAGEFFDIWFATDIRSVLGSVQAPTLVLHRPAADETDPARALADAIPGATLVELPGADYAPMAGKTGELLDRVEAFVTSIRAEERSFERVLATVLFTDIVGSTQTAAELGDVGWRALLERHHTVVRAMLGRYRGTEVDTAGDGFFATFDGPARGVRCAQAIVEAVRPLGLEVRAGLHTGEVEIIDGGVGGLAVHIGARVGAAAGPSEVLVSSTVKDLVAGSGLAFEDAGEHELKGVPDRWRLYRVIP